MTNYERIKGLSIEELAEELKLIANWDRKEVKKANNIEDFYVDYLNSESKTK
jgi:hypothetical protein